MRLDLYLTEKKIYASRTRSCRAIESGCVSVNGAVVTKPSYDVGEGDTVSAADDPVPFVSRGAFKLQFALERFNVDIKDKTAIDIGASTGGFTEIMLQAGAKTVYAIDVGHGQLALVLREDERVVNMEGTDVRSLTQRGFEEFFEFAACDASFISLTAILPSAYDLLKSGSQAVFLIKPQFEVGRKYVGKGGIVKNKAAVDRAITEVTEFARLCGFSLKAPIEPSPVKGGDGNTEYLMLLEKT